MQVTGLGLAPCLACAPARALPSYGLAAARTLPAAPIALAMDRSHSCAMPHVSYRQHQDADRLLRGDSSPGLLQCARDKAPLAGLRCQYR